MKFYGFCTKIHKMKLSERKIGNGLDEATHFQWPEQMFVLVIVEENNGVWATQRRRCNRTIWDNHGAVLE